MIELLDPVTLGSAQTRSLSPVPRGLNPPVSFAGVTWKKSDTVWHRPSETSRRSSRTPALLYPPDW